MTAAAATDVSPGLVYRPATGTDHALRLDLYRPREVPAAPLVLYLHGGAWLLGSRTDHPARLHALASSGVAVASIDYRLAHQASYPGQYEDIVGAMRWVQDHAGELGCLPGRVTLMGASAGAHLAALASLTYRGGDPAVAAFVGLFGNYDLTAAANLLRPAEGLPVPAEIRNATLPPGFDRMPPARELRAMLAGVPPDRLDDETLRELSPVFCVHADAPPCLVLHGTRDAVVDHSRSERFVEAARAAGMSAELVLVPGANHEGPEFDEVALLAQVASFVRYHAGTG